MLHTDAEPIEGEGERGGEEEHIRLWMGAHFGPLSHEYTYA
jgi:hypothetical protein